MVRYTVQIADDDGVEIHRFMTREDGSANEAVLYDGIPKHGGDLDLGVPSPLIGKTKLTRWAKAFIKRDQDSRRVPEVVHEFTVEEEEE